MELYCEKNMAQAMGSDWEPNIFIPAEKMIRTLDSPNMQSFRKEFNITAYGVKVYLQNNDNNDFVVGSSLNEAMAY